MSGNRIAIILAGAGVLIVVVSLLADVIGLGSNPGFGRQQLYGIVAGLLFLAVAVHRWRGWRRAAASDWRAEPAASEAKSADQVDEQRPSM